jgi:hypothetical protein
MSNTIDPRYLEDVLLSVNDLKAATGQPKAHIACAMRAVPSRHVRCGRPGQVRAIKRSSDGKGFYAKRERLRAVRPRSWPSSSK